MFLLVEQPNLCACMLIKPIEFKHMAVRCALPRLGRVVWRIGYAENVGPATVACRSLQYRPLFVGWGTRLMSSAC